MAAFGPKGKAVGTTQPGLTMCDVDDQLKQIDIDIENGEKKTQSEKSKNAASVKVTLFDDPMHPQQKTAVGGGVDKVTAAREAAALNRRDQTRAKDLAEKGTKSTTTGGSSSSKKVRTAKRLSTFLKRSKKQWMSWKGCVWVVLILLQLIGAVISIVLLLPKMPKTSGGWLDFGPRPTMLVQDHGNAVFLAISRITAYMMYPCLILTFTSKAHVLRTWIWSTQLRLYLPFFERLHDVHVRAGWVCFGLTWLHAVFHVIRWARLGHLSFFYEHHTGATGLVGWIAVTLVCLPMGLKCCRKRIAWEYRKTIHTVGGIAFGLSGAFHAPKTKVLYVYMTTVAIYVLDWLYANLYKSYEVETCHFTRLHNSVVLHWENPPGYNHAQHGYVNICIPFIKRYQWHAISIYPHATKPNCSSLCIAVAGDWSKKLYDDTKWKTTRPVWIQGPFLTPFSASVEFDNCICVSSGSGVSASLAALQSLKNHRRVNFIWLCRDHSMVEFYLKTYDFDDDGYTLVFYTGKSKLSVPTQLKPNVLVFTTRPNLRSIICMIIASIENEDGLPEGLLKASEEEEKRMQEYHDELHNIHNETDPLKVFKLLLQRSLKQYSQEELLKQLGEQSDDLSLEQMGRVFTKIMPEARFSTDGLMDLCAFFNDGASDAKTVSRQALVDHCQMILTESATKAGAKDPNGVAHKASSDDMKARFSADDGADNLLDLCGDDDEEKVSVRLSRWAVMYCGGSVPVSEALTKVCADFDIKYEQEKFDW